MGIKQTKFENSPLPDTPILQREQLEDENKAVTLPPLTIASLHQLASGATSEPKDPRSPSGYRTPLHQVHAATDLSQQQEQEEQKPIEHVNAFGLLRKRILKSFALSDPRSPKLNRTPLIFDDTVDRTLNLDDTFADLFVETRAPVPIVRHTQEIQLSDINVQKAEKDQPMDASTSLETKMLPYEEEETMACPAVLQSTPTILHTQQQVLDPRSPTVGIDRTPIIFNDDDEAHEDQMLENILETLTLNLSNDSIMASFVNSSCEQSQEKESEQAIVLPTVKEKPTNKHLERVRLASIKCNKPPAKPARRQRIYKDSENVQTTSTPKKTDANQSITPKSTKRTPLVCVNNHSQSVDHLGKKRKSHQTLQCIDDQLNTTEYNKVPSMHIIRTLEDLEQYY